MKTTIVPLTQGTSSNCWATCYAMMLQHHGVKANSAADLNFVPSALMRASSISPAFNAATVAGPPASSGSKVPNSIP